MKESSTFYKKKKREEIKQAEDVSQANSNNENEIKKIRSSRAKKLFKRDKDAFKKKGQSMRNTINKNVCAQEDSLKNKLEDDHFIQGSITTRGYQGPETHKPPKKTAFYSSRNVDEVPSERSQIRDFKEYHIGEEYMLKFKATKTLVKEKDDKNYNFVIGHYEKVITSQDNPREQINSINDSVVLI